MKKIVLANGLAALLASVSFPGVFDPGKPGWKKDADGKLVADENGNPIFIQANGTEGTIDGNTISRLNREAQTNREKAEDLEKKLKVFEGLDPVQAREAFDKLSKIDQKKLIDSGEIEKVKDEIGKGFTIQLAAKDEENKGLRNELNNMKIGSVFSSSQFIKDRIAIPIDMFRPAFEKYFKISETGDVHAVDDNGARLYSEKRIGEFATTEEALEQLVNKYAHKETILKANNNSGSGGGNGGNRGTGSTVSRADMDKMNPVQRAEVAAKANAGTVQIVD